MCGIKFKIKKNYTFFCFYSESSIIIKLVYVNTPNQTTVRRSHLIKNHTQNSFEKKTQNQALGLMAIMALCQEK